VFSAFITLYDGCVCDVSLQVTMACNVAGMAFIPYYNQIMSIIETNKDLKKTFYGLWAVAFMSCLATVAVCQL